MARGRGRKSDDGSSADIPDNASPDPLDGLLDPLPALPVDPLDQLEQFATPSIPHDRRFFHFGEPERFNLDVAEVTRGREGGTIAPSSLPSRVGFVVPRSVAVCVRRKERREVLHALGKVRKRGGGSRRKNLFSHVKC